MKTRIMLDLETLGTAPGSAILAIGAVKFGNSECYAAFYERVDLKTSVAAGLTMDPATVLWWLQQSDEARLEITRGGGGIQWALQQFSEWVWSLQREEPVVEGEEWEIEMWGNGASFDNVLLSVAYERVGLTRPWKYSNDRCYRTVKNLYPDIPLQRDGTHHNALDDARSQAMHLMAMLPSL